MYVCMRAYIISVRETACSKTFCNAVNICTHTCMHTYTYIHTYKQTLNMYVCVLTSYLCVKLHAGKHSVVSYLDEEFFFRVNTRALPLVDTSNHTHVDYLSVCMYMCICVRACVYIYI